VSFDDLRLLYVSSCVLIGLLVLSPTLELYIRLPAGESFSELYILGPEHMAKDYPSNVRANETYKIFLVVGNHMGGLEYYLVYVKLRNQSEPLPDSVNGTPSALEPIFEFRSFLGDNQTWETEVLFSVEGFSAAGNVSKISRVVIDDSAISVDKEAVWDAENKGFYYQIFFELWLYNAAASSFGFNQRFVHLWLNVTSSL
jgi:hypothetical protein